MSCCNQHVSPHRSHYLACKNDLLSNPGFFSPSQYLTWSPCSCQVPNIACWRKREGAAVLQQAWPHHLGLSFMLYASIFLYFLLLSLNKSSNMTLSWCFHHCSHVKLQSSWNLIDQTTIASLELSTWQLQCPLWVWAIDSNLIILKKITHRTSLPLNWHQTP